MPNGPKRRNVYPHLTSTGEVSEKNPDESLNDTAGRKQLTMKIRMDRHKYIEALKDIVSSFGA
jgi:hypothetical protein